MYFFEEPVAEETEIPEAPEEEEIPAYPEDELADPVEPVYPGAE